MYSISSLLVEKDGSYSEYQKFSSSLIEPFELRKDIQLPSWMSNFPIIAVEQFKEIEETSVIVQIQEKIRLLEELYIFSNPKEIRIFLLNNQYLIDILFEAFGQIIDTFGYVVEMHLELHRDPEADFEELFIVIKSTYSAEKARELMDKLGEEWFLDLIELTHNKLSITEEPL